VKPLAQLGGVVAATAVLGFLATPRASAVQPMVTPSPPSEVVTGPYIPGPNERITGSGFVMPAPDHYQYVVGGGPSSTTYSSRPLHTMWIMVRGRLRLVPV